MATYNAFFGPTFQVFLPAGFTFLENTKVLRRALGSFTLLAHEPGPQLGPISSGAV